MKRQLVRTCEQQFIEVAGFLRQLASRCDMNVVLIEAISDRLDGLPLPTFDYEMAKAHLANGLRYLACGETGAARWEFAFAANRIENYWS